MESFNFGARKRKERERESWSNEFCEKGDRGKRIALACGVLV